MKKNLIVLLIVPLLLVVSVSPAFAHVSVKPTQVGAAERINFVVSVPTEEDDPTVEVRLVIPDGMQNVRPNVKPGWTIALKKDSDKEDAKITEIVWSGGKIPKDQRDEFIFNAQAPVNKTTVVWKAYQTYGDGDVVAWENSPEVVKQYADKNPPKEGQEDDHNAPRPYSETKVVDDLSKSSTQPTTTASTSNKTTVSNDSPVNNWIGYTALLLGAISLALHLRKR